jgi:hypothetical protein
MAKFDVISNINYVKKITKNEKISYICHSQGCFQLFIGYTLNPKFFDESVDKFATMGTSLKISQIVNDIFLNIFIFIYFSIKLYFFIHKFFQKKKFPIILKKLDFFYLFEYFGIKNILSFKEENTKYFGYLCVK